MIIFLFYRNNFPAQQQLFCKSRSLELLPFRWPDPGASSESQAVSEHLLHEVILQTYSWYGFIKILLTSHNSCLAVNIFLFCFCVSIKNEKVLEVNVLLIFYVQQSHNSSNCYSTLSLS